MTIGSPVLYVIGGICLGLTLTAFSRHKFFGWLVLVLAAACLATAAVGNTVTIPKVHINPSSSSPSPSSSSPHSASPSPHTTG